MLNVLAIALTVANATGSVSADYDTVAFSVDIEERAESGPAANAALQKRVAKLDELYQRVQATTKVDKDSKRATNGLKPYCEYNRTSNKEECKGYEAWYEMRFSISEVDKATEIQNLLTSLDGMEVSAPVFGVKDQEGLKNKAVADAYKQVMRRFKNECKILGLDPNDYTVNAYSVNYMDHDGLTRFDAVRLEAAHGPAPVKIEVGKATVQVNLSVTFPARSRPPKRRPPAPRADRSATGPRPVFFF